MNDKTKELPFVTTVVVGPEDALIIHAQPGMLRTKEQGDDLIQKISETTSIGKERITIVCGLQFTVVTKDAKKTEPL